MPSTVSVEVPLGLEEDCKACADRVREGLLHHRGIASVDPASGNRLLVEYDPDLCSLACLDKATEGLRGGLSDQFEHRLLRVDGMDCYDCAQTIERAVSRLAGVTAASVNFPAARLSVEFEPSRVALEQVTKRVRGLGYTVSDPSAGAENLAATAWWRGRDALTALAAVLVGFALLADLVGAPRPYFLALYALGIAIGGWPVARSGIAALIATRRPDINLLMTIAVVGAVAIGAWFEAGLVVVLFSLGEALEGRAVSRARRELAGLVSLAPEVARVRRAHTHGEGAGDDEEIEIPTSEVFLGDFLVVRPGERIAADGRVSEGASTVDQAPITGESSPVDKAPGDEVFAGTLNRQGRIVVLVTSAPGDSTLVKIGRLVEEAQARKSPSERWVDSFARWYTPAVMVAAAGVMTIPLAFGASFQTSFYDGLALLILACPCALVISTPVTIVSALGRASAAGVLVKGGAHLEAAATIDLVAFDKTGTLTIGRPKLVSLDAFDMDEAELLRLAASLERGSEHPLAEAVIEDARGRGIALVPLEDFESRAGLGARGRVAGVEVELGSARYFGERLDERTRASIEERARVGQTVIVVFIEGTPAGVLGLADAAKSSAAEAISEIFRLGIARTVLLTGDNAAAAASIATALAISEVRSDLLPADKASAIENLGGRVAMVGDGVNDAPALAAAALGIAMGSAGSDTAIEVADVALMGDDPRKVAGLIGLARFTRSVVRQNIAFALGTKVIALVVLAAGALPLWGAVATDVGASLVVVANGLRVLRGRPRGRLGRMPILAAAPRRAEEPSRRDTIIKRAPAQASSCASNCCAPVAAAPLPAAAAAVHEGCCTSDSCARAASGTTADSHVAPS